MKKLIIFCLVGITIGCQQSVVAPLQECKQVIDNIAANHPLADSLQIILDNRVAEGLPGAVLVVETPDGKWVGASGMAKLETSEPMQPCNIFHSASVAKTYHAVAAMRLVEQGKLKLDNTIDNYLPSWVCADLPNRNTATVRQLMNHTSGIPDFIEKADHLMDYFNDLMRTFTQEDYLGYVCGDEEDFESGEGIAYSNTNTVLLALIMDEVAGNHADVITTEIINKLGLKNTFYKNEPGYPAPAGAVNTYLDQKGDGNLINTTIIERNFDSMTIGHDAMLASADDYFTFIQALMKGDLITESSRAEMLEVAPYSEQGGYGLGLEIIKFKTKDITMIGHNGGSLGGANNVFYYPEADVTIAVCSNFGDFFGSHSGRVFQQLLKDVVGITMMR